MNRYMVIMTLMLMTAVSVLTACGTDDELVMETSVMPVLDSEESGDDNSGNGSDNGNDNGNNDNENNGEKNEMSKNITIRVGNHSFAATFEENATAHAFAALMPMTVTMNEMNGNEKYHYLSENLPTGSSRPGIIRSGDLMLYGSNCIVLFYETFSSTYSYTHIGRIDHPSGLTAALGEGNVSVTFEINNNR